MINNTPAASANNPRGIININGNSIPFNSFTYDEQNYYQADTFRVNCQINDLQGLVDIDYWMSQPAIFIEIFAGFPANPLQYNQYDLTLLVSGSIGNLRTNKAKGTVVFSGRDLTSKFIDNKTYEKYPNNTFTQIAEKLATKRGLKFVGVPTKTLVGTYYDIDYVHNLKNQSTEWDLLTYLAQKEQYLIYVKGQTLYCIPLPDEKTDPYLIKMITPTSGISPSGNYVSLEIERDLTRALDVIVEVRTYNLRTGKPITIRVSATKNRRTVISGKAQPIGDAQVFSYEVKNMTPEQALQYAQNKIQEITQHERLMFFDTFADHILHKDSVISLVGYSTSADQIYYPDCITRTMSTAKKTYAMSVRAKNHSPQTVKLLS